MGRRRRPEPTPEQVRRALAAPRTRCPKCGWLCIHIYSSATWECRCGDLRITARELRGVA